MSDAIRKVLFIEPSNSVGETRDRVDVRYGNQWKEVGSRVNADGVTEVSIARPYETFIFEDFEGERFVKVERHYRGWLADLGINLSSTMVDFLRKAEVDAVVVRSGEVIDVRAVVAANGLLQVGGNRSPVPLIVEVGETLLKALDRDAALAGLRTYTSHGDPRYPSNVSLSPKAVAALTDSDHYNAIGSEVLDFIRSLQRPATVGELPMFAEVMPYAGIFLFNSNGDFTWLKGLVDVTHNMMPSAVAEYDPEAGADEVAAARSSALNKALQRAMLSEVRVADARHLDQSRNHAGIMRFSPEAVRREVERLSKRGSAYTDYRERFTSLVCWDLAGLEPAKRINSMARDLLKRGRVEVRR